MNILDTWLTGDYTVEAPKKHSKPKETEQKVNDSTRQAFMDLQERNDNFTIACGEAVELIGPFLERLKISLAKSQNQNETNQRFSIDCIAGIEKINYIKVLLESAKTGKTPIPKAAEPEKKAETILTTKVVLQTQLQKLTTIMTSKLVTGDEKEMEKLSQTLDQQTEYFNTISRALQEPLRKMKDFLKSVKKRIDFLKANPITESNFAAVSQYMIFLNSELIESFDHEIKDDMSELVAAMAEDVEKQVQQIANKVKEWEAKYDEFTSILVNIETACNRIEWRLHLCQYLQTLKAETFVINEMVKEYENGNDKHLKLLIKDRANSLAGARTEVDQFIVSYNTQNKALIEDLNVRLVAEKEKLRKDQKSNSPEASKAIMSQFHFYDAEKEKQNREQLEAAMAQSFKEITMTLNEIEVEWDDQFKTNTKKVIDNLEKFASSVITNNGEIRSGTWYALKEKWGANTKRFPLPNF